MSRTRPPTRLQTAMAREHKDAPAAAPREHFYITRDSQNAGRRESDSKKLSYVGMRNLTDVDMIEEQDIVSARGTIRGKRNRVRAGLANFENPKVLEKVIIVLQIATSLERGWGSICTRLLCYRSTQREGKLWST